MFVAPYILNLKYTIITAFLSHFLVDLLVFGASFGTSIFWELGTTCISVVLWFIANIKKEGMFIDFFKVLMLIISNIVIYSFVGLLDYSVIKSELVFWQIIVGVFIVNNLSYIFFYNITKKINKILCKKFKVIKEKTNFIEFLVKVKENKVYLSMFIIMTVSFILYLKIGYPSIYVYTRIIWHNNIINDLT